MTLRILLAEDEPNNREAATLILQAEGHEVVAVPDGLEAFRCLEAGTFDALVTDYMMPLMMGDALIKAVRADARFRDMPVLVTTAFADPVARSRMAEAGAEHILTKPFRRQALLAALAAALERPAGDAPPPC